MSDGGRPVVECVFGWLGDFDWIMFEVIGPAEISAEFENGVDALGEQLPRKVGSKTTRMYDVPIPEGADYLMVTAKLGRGAPGVVSFRVRRAGTIAELRAAAESRR